MLLLAVVQRLTASLEPTPASNLRNTCCRIWNKRRRSRKQLNKFKVSKAKSPLKNMIALMLARFTPFIVTTILVADAKQWQPTHYCLEYRCGCMTFGIEVNLNYLLTIHVGRQEGWLVGQQWCIHLYFYTWNRFGNLRHVFSTSKV